MKTKGIAVLIALVVLVSIGSAALVTYLSNRVDQDVIVSSPLVLDITIPEMHAGDLHEVDISIENLANEDVDGQVNINITVNDGVFDCVGITIYGGECNGGIFTFDCETYRKESIDTTKLKISTDPALEPITYGFSTVVRPC